jgi:aquaporin related protein
MYPLLSTPLSINAYIFNQGWAPALIGLAVFACHLSGIPVDGASLNPARSFGPAIITKEWDNQWVFWLGPIAGGLLAALVFSFTKKVVSLSDDSTE